MDIIKSFPLLIVLTLFISSFILLLIKKAKAAKTISLLSLSFALLLSAIHMVFVLRGGSYYYSIGYFKSPFGIEFYITSIEGIMFLLFSFVSLMVIWYSAYSIDKDIKETHIPLYYLLINILIGSLLGVVFTNDIFNSYVFIEVGTLAACGIIVVKDKKENIKATLKYLFMSCLGSGLILMGIAFLYTMTGQLNMSYIHQSIINVQEDYKRTILITLSLFTVGLGVKSAMFPMHNWLPDAHSSAPAPSSAILSSLVVKAYAILLIKVLYRIFGLDIINQFPVLRIILILGSAGMIMGSVMAIFQKEIKRVIAYSTVAQMGYIFMGVGMGTELGISIAYFHIIGHAITKAALFLTVGFMIEHTGNKKIKDFHGIGKRLPLTLSLFTAGALSMVGIPLLPGFASKWNFALASIHKGELTLIGVILISSLLNAVYYLPIAINGFFGEEQESEKEIIKGIFLKELLPVVILSLCMVYLGAASEGIIELINMGLI
ncbi:Na(+)/H(+) antiporter subunit D [Oxobacter pfennigii]|uniref:Na(+)/H(+) antiporter subunit D n=1 Tax=Oxobacter pfennigii TaxID=36849 RepID=A0A0P8Y766_9CLOT|nr:proton-conducting transporter membrane subunit [Oxobacter pfennigii]KPU42301.1 Na(+)/H(+) antiporter subunit D [Oxobacter pfennigii]